MVELSKIELSSDCVCVAQWLLQMSSKQSLQSLISLCIYSLKPNLDNSCNNTSNLHADLRSLQAHNKVYIGYYAAIAVERLRNMHHCEVVREHSLSYMPHIKKCIDIAHEVALNSVSENGTIEMLTDGASSNTVKLLVTFVIRR